MQQERTCFLQEAPSLEVSLCSRRLHPVCIHTESNARRSSSFVHRQLPSPPAPPCPSPVWQRCSSVERALGFICLRLVLVDLSGCSRPLYAYAQPTRPLAPWYFVLWLAQPSPRPSHLARIAAQTW